MTRKMHELLAVENTVTGNYNKMLGETEHVFGQSDGVKTAVNVTTVELSPTKLLSYVLQVPSLTIAQDRGLFIHKA